MPWPSVSLNLLEAIQIEIYHREIRIGHHLEIAQQILESGSVADPRQVIGEEELALLLDALVESKVQPSRQEELDQHIDHGDDAEHDIGNGCA